MSYDIEAEEQECQKVEQKQRLWDWLRKLRRDEQNSPNNGSPKPDTPPQTPARANFGRRLSRKKVGVGIPRSTTFRRQEEEQRKNLEPVEHTSKERRDISSVRQRALSAQPKPVTSKQPRRETSAPDLGYHHDAYPSIDSRIQTHDFGNGYPNDDQEQIPPPPPPPPQPPPDADLNDDIVSQASYDTNNTLDEEIQLELEKKWILNLSMHFRDKSPREKFFITFAETPQKWRRVTVSCDYRNAEDDSLEADLQTMSSQREKSGRIYESLRGSLGDIQFYDTVTNLKLETRDERLHVHVTEDVNEIINYPSIRSINHLKHVRQFREGDLHFKEHMSGFVYKVEVEGYTWIKKEIPGPDSVDEFLYEVNALSSLVKAENVIRLQGLVISDDDSTVKGLLIAYAEKNALVDIIYDNHGNLPWARRQRWAKQIIKGLSEIHEAGFVQGDFTLSNIVIDGNDEAKIIDINRRGCPVGWEPPEIAKLIESGQRISMFIGVKSDLFQLGMVLWGLAMEEDEPERKRPLTLGNAPSEVLGYYREIVARCLDADPAMRLSATDLLKEFPAFVTLEDFSAAMFPEVRPAQQIAATPIVTGSTSRAEVSYPKRISTPDCNGAGEVTTTIPRYQPGEFHKPLLNGEREYTEMLSRTARSTERRYSQGAAATTGLLHAPVNAETHSSIEPQASSSAPEESALDTSNDISNLRLDESGDLSEIQPIPSRGRLTEAEEGQVHIPDQSNDPQIVPISPTGEPTWEDVTSGPTPYLIHRDTLDSFDSNDLEPPTIHRGRNIYHWEGSPAANNNNNSNNGDGTRRFTHVDSGLADIDTDHFTEASPPHHPQPFPATSRGADDLGTPRYRDFQHVDSGLADMNLACIGCNETLSFAERAHKRGLSNSIGGMDIGDITSGEAPEQAGGIGEELENLSILNVGKPEDGEGAMTSKQEMQGSEKNDVLDTSKYDGNETRNDRRDDNDRNHDV